MLQSWEGDRYPAEKEMYSVVAAIQTYKSPFKFGLFGAEASNPCILTGAPSL